MTDPEPSSIEPAASDVERAIAYHERSKHHLRRFARSLGYLDWAAQPDPFRRWRGAPRVELPLRADDLETRYADLYQPAATAPRAVDLGSVATLLELSLGLSAWKESGKSRWALRCNPSSGNLHPTEGYLLCAGLEGLPPGLHHYLSEDHLLEQRAQLDGEAAAMLTDALPAGGFSIALTSVHWREAWKYGERAFRYCQHDCGHAIAAIRYAAAALGWSAALVDDLGDATLARLLGLDRDEDFAAATPLDREHPDTLLLVAPATPVQVRSAAAALARRGRELADAVADATWTGSANRLSTGYVLWEVIDEVSAATARAPAPDAPPWWEPPPRPPLVRGPDAGTAASLIRRRRSALAFDEDASEIETTALYAMLDRALPRAGIPPWDALPWAPRVHLVMFVHRVAGLTSGLYALERDAAVHERLRAAMRPELEWVHPPGCPDHLPLYRLVEGDYRQVAQVVSCHQQIAAEGAFSLGMVADFAGALAQHGASFYRRLFWEAGVIGQVLYLEAEAWSRPERPVRATGIGCYFDDAFHELLGLTGHAFQSLYHFTTGGPIEDTRLHAIEPYAHLGTRAP